MFIFSVEKKSAMSLVVVSSLLLLTGCFGEKSSEKNSSTSEQQDKSSDKGEVLLTIDGKPALYAADFEEQKMMAQQSNQQLNMILQMMPDAAYSMLFKSIEAGLLMKEWVQRAGINQTAEYKNNMRQVTEQIEMNLCMQEFQKAHPIEVTDHEIKKFYEEKRDQVPGLIVTPASVDIAYVVCTSKSAADALHSKLRDGSEKHLQMAAKEADLKVTAANVTQNSSINDLVKNAALQATKFPSKEIIKVDENAYWVISVLKKHDAKYHTLDNPQVKEFMKKSCQDAKREVELTKQIEKLSKEYNIIENTSYFERKKENQDQAMQKAQAMVMQAAKSGQDADMNDNLTEE